MNTDSTQVLKASAAHLTTYNGGITHIGYAAEASDALIASGGIQLVALSGSAQDTHNQGILLVAAEGSTGNLVNAGGTTFIRSGGHLSGVSLSAGVIDVDVQGELSGLSATGTLASGESRSVRVSGYAENLQLTSGTLTVTDYGIASNVELLDGGDLIIQQGTGRVKNLTLTGGSCHVGGMLEGALTVNSGAATPVLIVSSQGVVSCTLPESMVNPVVFSVCSGGQLTLTGGGSGVHCHVLSGGLLTEGSTTFSFGLLTVNPGGATIGGSLTPGGTATVNGVCADIYTQSANIMVAPGGVLISPVGATGQITVGSGGTACELSGFSGELITDSGATLEGGSGATLWYIDTKDFTSGSTVGYSPCWQCIPLLLSFDQTNLSRSLLPTRMEISEGVFVACQSYSVRVGEARDSTAVVGVPRIITVNGGTVIYSPVFGTVVASERGVDFVVHSSVVGSGDNPQITYTASTTRHTLQGVGPYSFPQISSGGALIAESPDIFATVHSCGVCFCATPEVAKSIRVKSGGSMLLPTAVTSGYAYYSQVILDSQGFIGAAIEPGGVLLFTQSSSTGVAAQAAWVRTDVGWSARNSVEETGEWEAAPLGPVTFVTNIASSEELSQVRWTCPDPPPIGEVVSPCLFASGNRATPVIASSGEGKEAILTKVLGGATVASSYVDMGVRNINRARIIGSGGMDGSAITVGYNEFTPLLLLPGGALTVQSTGYVTNVITQASDTVVQAAAGGWVDGWWAIGGGSYTIQGLITRLYVGPEDTITLESAGSAVSSGVIATGVSACAIEGSLYIGPGCSAYCVSLGTGAVVSVASGGTLTGVMTASGATLDVAEGGVVTRNTAELPVDIYLWEYGNFQFSSYAPYFTYSIPMGSSSSARDSITVDRALQRKMVRQSELYLSKDTYLGLE